MCFSVYPGQRCWVLLAVSKSKNFVPSLFNVFLSFFLVAVTWTKLFTFGPSRKNSLPLSSITWCLMWKQSVLCQPGCCLLRWQVLHPSWIIPRSLNPGTVSAGTRVLWALPSILQERDRSKDEEQCKQALPVLWQAKRCLDHRSLFRQLVCAARKQV